MNRERREREREEEGETERERRGGGDRDRQRARRGGGDREREKRRGERGGEGGRACVGVCEAGGWGEFLKLLAMVAESLRTSPHLPVSDRHTHTHAHLR